MNKFQPKIADFGCEIVDAISNGLIVVSLLIGSTPPQGRSLWVNRIQNTKQGKLVFLYFVLGDKPLWWFHLYIRDDK